jgi:hypothetical protein
MPSASGAPQNAGRITRRDFNRRAVQTAAGILLAGSAVATSAVDIDDATPPSVPARSRELDAALVLVHSAAPHLPAEDHAELEEQVKGVLASADRLRAHPLPDGAEPAFVFLAASAEQGS